MQTYDVKRERADLYGARRGDPVLVEVPPLDFLMVHGHGDPNTASSYRAAVAALFTASYAVRAAAKAHLGEVHTVGPLEGLWYAEDPAVFRTRDKDAWSWTLMIVQPAWITPELVGEALTGARRTRPVSLDDVRFERFAEGRCVQLLHVGSYDDEGPVLERLHREFLPAHGLVPAGCHHEIYLSDARRVEPARRRTILRQPVRRPAPA